MEQQVETVETAEGLVGLQRSEAGNAQADLESDSKTEIANFSIDSAGETAAEPDNRQTDVDDGSKDVEVAPPLLTYDHIEPCLGCGGRHGDIVFTSGRRSSLDSPEDLSFILPKMDVASQSRLNYDLERLFAQGKMIRVASGERLRRMEDEIRRQQGLQHERAVRDLMARKEALETQAKALKLKKLSLRGLTTPVTRAMEDAIADKPELANHLKEMCRRGLKITIQVSSGDSNIYDDDSPSDDEVLLEINPAELIGQDVAQEEARLEEDKSRLVEDGLRLMGLNVR